MPVVPETHKTPGVCYAYAPEGLELPVIDVAHPAFHLDLSDADLEAQAAAFVAMQERGNASWLARLFRRYVVPRLLRRSRLGRGLAQARHGYLDGISTYLLKLGPSQLGSGWANDMDRRIAASFPVLNVRLRLQDAAGLLAQALAPALAAAPRRPLHLVNLAGGPSVDSLNALLLLWRDPAKPLAGRSVRIHVLDLEADGAAFAAAALAAWLEPGAPLQGLDASLDHMPYDWNDPSALAQTLASLPQDAVLGLSSEGGLWDYAPDPVVRNHFQILRQAAPKGATFMGSISRPDGAGQQFVQDSLTRLERRSLEGFSALAQSEGWQLLASRQRPLSTVLTLKIS